jgi:flagellar motility protein MotE (MotC chaperone)
MFGAKDRLIARQQGLIDAQRKLIRALEKDRAESEKWRQRRELFLASHMCSCPTVGETTRAKWDELRAQVEEDIKS